MRHTLALLTFLACTPTGPIVLTTDDAATSTTTATTDDSTTGVVSPTTGSSNDTSSGSTSSSVDPTTGPFMSEGKCVAFGPATCVQAAEDLCADVVLLCVAADLAPGFCNALGDRCEAGDVSPCETCKDLWQECVRVVGDVVDQGCEDLAEQCTCLVESHGAV